MTGAATSEDSTPERPAGPVPTVHGDAPGQERPVAPDPERRRGSRDPEAPEGDALDQAREVAPGERAVPQPPWQEASEADAWEQSLEVPLDDEDRRS